MASEDEIPARELAAQALAADGESDERWRRIWALHRRNDRETFDAGRELVASDAPEAREVGVDILAQLGAGWDDDQRPFRTPTVDLLLELFESESAVQVLDSVGAALGHLHDPRGIAPLAALADHSDEDVRLSVVHGLSGHDDDLAVATLIQLTEDADTDVRDWATFGLGTLIDRDSSEIRSALLARVVDADPDTRGEALVGLAQRGDTRGVEPLLVELEGFEGPLLDEALFHYASRVDDARLCGHVATRWREWSERSAEAPLERGAARDELFVAAAKRCGLC